MAQRRRSAYSRVQRDSYLLSRTMGDLSAAARGPVPLARRLARRSLTRSFFRSLRNLSR
jgi:hypothetical protein